MQIIGKRYQIAEMIGQGGMGEVYRAVDRLTGSTVALKRVTVQQQALDVATRRMTSDPMNRQMALAQEFKVLATLRHPHIISVLDYGFDVPDASGERTPFFTMDLLPEAKPITEAAHELPLTKQFYYLSQMLQALVYLHRRDTIHRDLKPANVLVSDDSVKVLDFGLATAVNERQGVVGTLAYMAPEVLRGEAVTVRADLYAVGMIAYEMIVGVHPLDDVQSAGEYVQYILQTPIDLSVLKVEAPVVNIIGRLLAKDPEDRYASAEELLAAFSEAAGLPIAPETVMIRESFLQGAQLIGREEELGVLTGALRNAMMENGSTWLIGGESGIGKSRLVDELRTRGLVEGALVLRGQGIAEGGAPYLLWRDVLRYLCLYTELSDLEASVLKSLVPDISRLLEREVADAPELDPEGANNRLLNVIEDLFRRQGQAILLLMEDLHWAQESLEVLPRLTRIVKNLPLMIVATYRDDERPTLPDDLPGMQVMKVERLGQDAIANVSAAMLGEAVGRQPQVIDLLQRESEGIIFFIVEVVRALAEEAGQLDHIGRSTLPQKVFAKGIRSIMERRLQRLPESARVILRVAAIAGRQIDLEVLRLVMPAVEWDAWLSQCADAKVLEISDNRWRFAHDKLRDGLLEQMPTAERRATHSQLARALETVHPEEYSLLMFHFGEAGDAAKEAHYAARAGEEALKNGAHQPAITFFERALWLAEEAGTPALRQAALVQQSGFAYYALGNIDKSRQLLEEALARVGYPQRPPTMEEVFGRLNEAAARTAERTPLPAPANTDPAGLLIAAASCAQLGQIAYFNNDAIGGTNYILLGLGFAEQAGDAGKPQLARFYISLLVIVGIVGIHPVAEMFGQRAVELMATIDDRAVLSYVHQLKGNYAASRGRWQEANIDIPRSLEVADSIGTLRLWEESTMLFGTVSYFQGNWTESAARFDALYAVAEKQEHWQAKGWVCAGWATLLMRQKRLDEALTYGLETNIIYETVKDPAFETWALGSLIQVYLRIGDDDSARRYAEKSVALIAPASPSAFHSLEGYIAVCEFYMRAWQKSAAARDDALKSVEYLQRFASVFEIGKPAATIYQAWASWLDDKADDARTQGLEAITLARQYAMPFYEGLAHLYITRYLPEAERPMHDEAAQRLFKQVGATGEVLFT